MNVRKVKVENKYEEGAKSMNKKIVNEFGNNTVAKCSTKNKKYKEIKEIIINIYSCAFDN